MGHIWHNRILHPVDISHKIIWYKYTQQKFSINRAYNIGNRTTIIPKGVIPKDIISDEAIPLIFKCSGEFTHVIVGQKQS